LKKVEMAKVAELMNISMTYVLLAVSTRKNAMVTSGGTWWKSTETGLWKYSDVIKY